MSFESQHRMQTEWESLSCPFCSSVFRVSPQDIPSFDYYSFSCLSCSKIFWASLSKQGGVETFIQKPALEKQTDAEGSPSEDKICPNCYTTIKKGSTSCFQCGNFFYDSKWLRSAPLSSFKLRRAFENVLQDYQDKNYHDRFARLCIRENNTAFGLYCYNSLLKKKPKDEQALHQIKYFKAVLSVLLSKDKAPAVSNNFGRSYLSGWLHSFLIFSFLLAVLALFLVRSLLT